MPTSITAAPGLTMSARDDAGLARPRRRGRRPRACDRAEIARAASGRSSRSRSLGEQQHAPSACRRCSLRPTTTARAPSSGTSYSASSAMIPAASPARSVGWPMVEHGPRSSGGSRPRPCAGRSRGSPAPRRCGPAAAAGRGSRRPASSAFSSATSASSSSSRRRRPAAGGRSARCPTSSHASCLRRDVDVARRGPRRRARSRARRPPELGDLRARPPRGRGRRAPCRPSVVAATAAEVTTR